jgi:hypothetical protein
MLLKIQVLWMLCVIQQTAPDIYKGHDAFLVTVKKFKKNITIKHCLKFSLSKAVF